MCGPSAEQYDLEKQQASFASSLRESFAKRFAGQDEILSKLNNSLGTVFAAGPGQHGFTDPELRARNAQALDNTAQNYANVARATNEQLAGRGGDSGLQSGVDSQIKAAIATQGAQELSREQQGITTADYATGRDNYFKAAAGMDALAGQYDPQNFASLGNSAGHEAFGQQHSIDEQKGAFWKTLGGAVTGVAGLIPGIGTGISALHAGLGALRGGSGFSQNDDYLAAIDNGGGVAPSSND